MNSEFTYPKNFLRYLGTGGARFTMIRQLRKTGGIWVRYGGQTFVVDPGPGSLVQISEAYPLLNSMDINTIFLTHRHIDHSTDINVLAEAMTHGGRIKRGIIIGSHDAFYGNDPVLLKYSAAEAERVICFEDGKRIELENGISVEPVLHIHHRVDCFGLIFRKKGLRTWGIISDTHPLPWLHERYKDCDFISVNMTMLKQNDAIDHMSLQDVEILASKSNAELITVTHLGGKLLEGKPEKIINKMINNTRLMAAKDRMIIDLDKLDVYSAPERRKLKTKYKLINV